MYRVSNGRQLALKIYIRFRFTRNLTAYVITQGIWQLDNDMIINLLGKNKPTQGFDVISFHYGTITRLKRFHQANVFKLLNITIK